MSENNVWELVRSVGTSPKCYDYEYKSTGRLYKLTVCVIWSRTGEPALFGGIILNVNNKKIHRFGTGKRLAEFLAEKGVPVNGIEWIIQLK